MEPQTPDYSQMTELELLSELANQLYGNNVEGFGPSDIRQRIEDARRFAQAWLDRNRAALCRRLDALGLRDSKVPEALIDSAVIAEVIAGMEVGSATAAILAALIIKWGVPAICP